jgi:hypothetical protein
MYQIMDSIMNETEGSGRWDVSTVFIRPDGSYLIRRLDIVCGDALYHVPDEGKWKGMFDALTDYVSEHPETLRDIPVHTPTLEELKTAKKARIDEDTSAAILAGFDYAVNGVTYHFSYDAFDQQNFADTANVCIMKQAGMPGLPDSVMWNAYTVPDDELVRLTFDAPGFLALYAGGAMKHKNETMQRGGDRKAAVEAAATADVITAA